MDTIQMTSKSKILSEITALQRRLTVQEQLDLATILLFSRAQLPDEEVEAHNMMPSSMMSYEHAKQHQAELLREAERIHLANEATIGEQSPLNRASIRLGKLLVSTGFKLIARPVTKTTAIAH